MQYHHRQLTERSDLSPLVRAFTLIELLVAVSIMVLVILGLGQVFRSAGRAIRTSNATLEVDASARGVMRQIANDLSRIDRDGFLVIRTNSGGEQKPPTRSQMSFLAHGAFANRTGGIDPANPSNANVSAHAAHIWYGFGLTPQDLIPVPSNGVVNNPGIMIDQNSGVYLSSRAMGSTDANSAENSGTLARHVFLLIPANKINTLEQITAPAGGDVPTHANIAYNGPAITVNGNELPATPSSGRTSVASLTPSQLMARVRYLKYQPIQVQPFFTAGAYRPYNVSGVFSFFREGGPVLPLFSPGPLIATSWCPTMPPYDGSDYWYEARNYCYPFKVLHNPRDGKNASNGMDVANGVFRISPVLRKYCAEFKVEWTDGQIDVAGNLRWVGAAVPDKASLDVWRNKQGYSPKWPPVDFYAGSRAYGIDTTNDSCYPPLTDKLGEYSPTRFGDSWNTPVTPQAFVARDIYTAVFSFDNREKWPKAIRIQIRVQIPGAEINTNQYDLPTRTYTQVVWLPQ